MSHRIVRGIKFAAPCARPACIPKGRPRGAKREGIRYERGLADRLDPRVWVYGQWWEYIDDRGHGYCQTDFHYAAGDSVIVLECKLTWTPEGHQQIAQLYAPVLSAALRVPVLGIVVARKLLPECK